MFALEAAVEAFRVQNAIHVGSARPSTRIWRIGPQSCKGFSIFSAAFEARPVTGGKSGYFVEEEKLGIVLPPYVTMTSIEFQAAADPRYDWRAGVCPECDRRDEIFRHGFLTRFPARLWRLAHRRRQRDSVTAYSLSQRRSGRLAIRRPWGKYARWRKRIAGTDTKFMGDRTNRRCQEMLARLTACPVQLRTPFRQRTSMALAS